MALVSCAPCAQIEHTLATSWVSPPVGGLAESLYRANKFFVPPCDASLRGALIYSLPGFLGLDAIPR